MSDNDYDQGMEYPEHIFSSDSFDGRIDSEPSQRHSGKMPQTNAEHQKAWRQRNPEKHRENMRQYMANKRKQS